MDSHLKGMLIAFSITSLFIVYFIGKIRSALREHNETLARLKDQKIQNEKLSSLATLAAGAAHELATPLSTIKLAAGEMLYQVKQTNDQELIDDIELIRDQIEKCQSILNQMSEDSGEYRGENFTHFTIETLIQGALTMLPLQEKERVAVNISSQQERYFGPDKTFRRIIKGLLKNAFDAGPTSTVGLKGYTENQYLCFLISDSGTGMDVSTLSRATEPFFTTKEPGKGLGLGLFLAKSVAEQFNGVLEISSTKNSGTEVLFKVDAKRLQGTLQVKGD